MDNVLPKGKVFQAGTLSGNPLAMSAGIATLHALQEPKLFASLERKAAMLAEGLEDEAREAKIPVAMNQIGSMLTLFFLKDFNDESSKYRVNDKTITGNIVERSTAASSTGGVFSPKITDWETASHCDTARYAKFFWGMLELGFYLPCSQFETFFISQPMQESDILATITAASEVFKTL
jgi:glutamate-1-semialdehyde 2,1-aminomutase